MQFSLTKTEKDLFHAISLIETENECKNFLRDLLTEAEIKEFSNRWKVAQLLDQKVAYKKIEQQTGMSSTTIARIQKWLTKGMNGYKDMLNKTKIINANSAHHLPT